ncbi:MAG: response regulator transcription factor [Acidimicrobiia bacterium]
MRVLVVEDEVRLATAIAHGLVAEGYDVDVAHDGPTGLWRAREHDYGVIVLDLLLPGMNGFRVCATLRAEDNWTPILVLTAKDGDYDVAEALDSGADDFLSKPFSMVVLHARLRALVRRRREIEPALLTRGSLCLDIRRRTCHLDGSEIHLTPREFSLLEHLVRQGDFICSKDSLLAEVWGPDFAGDPNIVEVYVRYLRKKLDGPGAPSIIETIRGIGYRVVDRVA